MTDVRPGAVPVSVPRPSPRGARWLPPALVAWAAGYGGLRLCWALGEGPAFPPPHSDVSATHAWVAALAAVAAVLGAALHRAGRSRPLLVGGWLVVAGLAASCPILLLDAVGLVLPGLGLPAHPAAALTRLGVVAGAGLLGAALVDYQRRCRTGCPRCGRPAGTGPTGTPWWARLAGYLAVVGCVVRLAAQVAVGLDSTPFAAGPSVVAFEVGFLLAGVLLPLALVHSWGRRWPRWVLPLAGRRVPRWLVLGPAFGVSAGLVVYFGVGIGQLAVETIRGEPPADLPLAFFWVAMPAYWVWGLGLGVAALAYHRATRPPCRRCGR